MLDREDSQLVNHARVLGDKGLKIYLDDTELLRLCAIVAADLQQVHLIKYFDDTEDLERGYYRFPNEWFKRPVHEKASFEYIFKHFKSSIQDFATYFKSLCEIHKRRLKFQLILENQPFPQMEQIVPRCLLEYGLRPSETLASWLVWRKWLYDIDNRSAQETGYLFEPILASSLGGAPYAAKKSPIKRADKPGSGRQVDCVEEKNAYEFKMRVTIAASGQGRFREELDFARDCHSSGYRPILLVLDPTPSTRLNELKSEYSKFGGEAYIGDEAWKHIEEKAGYVMGAFVEKYVKVPLNEVDLAYTKLQSIQLDDLGNEIKVRIGDTTFSFHRPLGESGKEELQSSDQEVE